jgi:hypothetical protein
VGGPECKSTIIFKKYKRQPKKDFIAGKQAEEDDSSHHIKDIAKEACKKYNETKDKELYYVSARQHEARCKSCEVPITPVLLSYK